MEKRDSLKRTLKFSEVLSHLDGSILYTQEELVNASLPYSKLSGIYFLIKDKEIVYIGQSGDVHARLSQHKFKDFDSVSVITCNADKLDKIESIYIMTYRPKLNGLLSNGDIITPLKLKQII
jgi:excinuclease UvrABC nuclease subunit